MAADGGNEIPVWERWVTAVPKAAIRCLDTLLRRLTRVQEFTDEGWCLLRFAVVQSPQDIALSDGTQIARGEAIGELHLWNEHIPPMPRSGPDLAWGLRAYTLLVRSFRALARHAATDPELSGLRAWHGKSSFLPRGVDTPELLTKLGFEVVRPHDRTAFRRFADFWDNFYWWMLAWTFNPASLVYKDLFKLERWEVWIPGATLQQKYGNLRSSAQLVLPPAISRAQPAQ